MEVLGTSESEGVNHKNERVTTDKGDAPSPTVLALIGGFVVPVVLVVVAADHGHRRPLGSDP